MFGDQLKFGDNIQVELGNACSHVGLKKYNSLERLGRVLCPDCNQWVASTECVRELVQTNSEENTHVG